jgi:NADH-quinone oxidoreductase subunit L
MRNMGGLRRWMPRTHFAFLSCALAIAGCPLTSGFFSKDEILGLALKSQIHATTPGEPRWEAGPWFGHTLYAVGVIAATMTAFYIFRALFMTFWGDFRGWKVEAGTAAPHESPRAMTVPLIILALFALEVGFLNAGIRPFEFTPFEHWLHPLFADTQSLVKVTKGGPSETLLLAVATAIFALGAGSAYVVYVMNGGAPARLLAEKLPRLYRLVLDKFRVDELYDRTIVAFLNALSEVAADFDTWVVDGIISRVTSALVALAGTLLRAFQTGVVHVYGAVMALGIVGLGWFFVWRPDASMTVEQKVPGHYTLEARPGIGYRFRWYSKSSDRPDTDAFGDRRTIEVDLSDGEPRKVMLEVKNAFERTAIITVDLHGGPAGEP